MEALRTVLVRVPHVAQVLLASYGLLTSYRAIVRLQKYEKTSEKLAEWSKEAARQLKLTRTTQAAAVLAFLSSVVAATTMTVYYYQLPTWIRFATSPILLVGVIAARTHMKAYWAPKDGQSAAMNIPLPKMKDYSEATLQTQDLLKLLEYLEYSWLATSFINAVLI